MRLNLSRALRHVGVGLCADGVHVRPVTGFNDFCRAHPLREVGRPNGHRAVEQVLADGLSHYAAAAFGERYGVGVELADQRAGEVNA